MAIAPFGNLKKHEHWTRSAKGPFENATCCGAAATLVVAKGLTPFALIAHPPSFTAGV
jgi:hypothetical protein